MWSNNEDMFTATHYMYDDTAIQTNANLAKDALLVQLEADGVIDSAEELANRYVILTARKGCFGRLWDKVRGKYMPEDTLMFIVAQTNPNTLKNKKEKR